MMISVLLLQEVLVDDDEQEISYPDGDQSKVFHVQIVK